MTSPQLFAEEALFLVIFPGLAASRVPTEVSTT